jgi:hypothetical protein
MISEFDAQRSQHSSPLRAHHVGPQPKAFGQKDGRQDRKMRDRKTGRTEFRPKRLDVSVLLLMLLSVVFPSGRPRLSPLATNASEQNHTLYRQSMALVQVRLS